MKLSTTLLITAASLALDLSAFAQLSPPGDAVQLQRVVITAVAAPTERLSAALSVSSISRDTLTTTAPRTTIEMLKSIPGVFVEASAGEVSNNIGVRGVFPNGYTYVALEEDGLPVISESNLAATNADNWTRNSLWIDHIEAVVGGTSGIFTSNASLATVNFLSREGGQTLSGETEVSVSDYNLKRGDFWLSGPIDQNTTFAFGGFYREDHGLRDPGFTANRGGQLTFNVAHRFGNGKTSVKVSGKYLNDRNSYQLPFPLRNQAAPNSIPGGIDIGDGSGSGSPDTRHFRFPGTPIGDLDYDLADGLHVDLKYIGTEITHALSDSVTLIDRNRFSSTDKSRTSNPFTVAQPLQVIANGIGRAYPTLYGAALDPVTKNYAFALSYPGQGGQSAAANQDAASTLNTNGLGTFLTYTYSADDIENFQNDMRLLFTPSKALTLTAGWYYAWLRDRRLNLTSSELISIEPRYRRLDVTFLDATTAQPIGQATYNGIRQLNSSFRHDSGDEDDNSLYASGKYEIGSFVFDVGVRFQHLNVNGKTEGTALFDLNQSAGTVNIPALKGARFGNGLYTNGSQAFDATAQSFGALFKATKSSAIFARASSGPRMPNLTDVLANIPTATLDRNLVSRVQQLELGYAIQGNKWSLAATVFEVQQKNVFTQNVQLSSTGAVTLLNSRYSTQSRGVELEAKVTPVEGLLLSASVTTCSPKMTSHNTIPGTSADGTATVFDINGNTPIRDPKLFGLITSSYTFSKHYLDGLSLFSSWYYVAAREADFANTKPSPLGSYSEVSLGASYRIERYTARISVANLFNSHGITEGDARTSQLVQDLTSKYFNARPIAPRSIVVSLGYRF